jgi:Mn-dependent DtxR family transcriptional regulator
MLDAEQPTHKEKVFNLIKEQTELKKSVAVSYISQKLGFKRDYLQEILDELQEQGYIGLKSNGGVTLVWNVQEDYLDDGRLF